MRTERRQWRRPVGHHQSDSIFPVKKERHGDAQEDAAVSCLHDSNEAAPLLVPGLCLFSVVPGWGLMECGV